MREIQMVDLFNQYLNIKEDVDQAINHVITTSSFINGQEVKLFSRELEDFTGSRFVITCGNGTDALQIAMMALDFSPGDEVIVPAFTYVATVETIALLGLKPVFVDVDPETFNIDIEAVVNKMSKRTVGIVPVHLFGQCANMEELIKISAPHNIRIIEDAAQSIGAEYQFSDGSVKQAGTIGTIGTTSFFPSKNLGCFGDGGALFTDSEPLAKKMQMIANHGQKVKYHHDIVGINSRLDTLQAGVLRVKLKNLRTYIQSRQNAANFYDEHLKKIDNIMTPNKSPNSTHVYHQYTLKVKGNEREELQSFLKSKKIPTMVYYPVPLHLQNAYKAYGYGEGDFPVSEDLSKRVLSLPIHTELSNEQLLFITESIQEFYQ